MSTGEGHDGTGAVRPPDAGYRLFEVLSPLLGARCVVVAGARGCVVVDAGAFVADEVEAVVRRTGRPPRAVLATHGHLDHVWDAGRLAERLDVPVVVHPADRARLDDPVGTLGLPVEMLLAGGLDLDGYQSPRRVLALGEDRVAALLDLGGLVVQPWHAPGHTEGSTVFELASTTDPPRALTGDVLFAGSVGRTDLPGGDPVAMETTLRRLVAHLQPGTALLPGHGPATRLARELAGNPYLRAVRRPGPND